MKRLLAGLVLALLSVWMALPAHAGAVRRGSKQWVMSQVQATLPAAGTYYVSITGDASIAYTSTLANKEMLWATNAVFSGLRVRLPADIGGAGPTLAATLYQNGSPTAMTCTITGAGATETTCSDSTHPILVTAGDRLAYQIVMTGTANAISATYAVLGTNVKRHELVLPAHKVRSQTSANRYSNAFGNTPADNISENTLFPAPTGAVVQAVYAAATGGSAGPDNGAGTQTWTYTLRSELADVTGSACVISETATSCATTGIGTAISAGNRLAILDVPANSPVGLPHMALGVLLLVDRSNTSWLPNQSNSNASTSAAAYQSLASGNVTRNATESAMPTHLPSAGTISTLQVNTSANPTPGNYTVTLRSAGPTTLTATVVTGETSHADTTHVVSVNQDDAVSWELAPASSPTAVNVRSAGIYEVP